MNQRPQSKGLKLFKILALAGFMIDIITVGAIFVVLGHDVGGPLECTSTNGLCSQEIKTTAQCAGASVINNVTESSVGVITLNCVTPDTASTFQCPGTSGSTLQYAFNITETSAGSISFLCKQVNWNELTSIPASVCGAGTFLTAINPLTCTSITQNHAPYFFISGALTVSNPAGNEKMYYPYNSTCTKVVGVVNTAPAGSSIIFSINNFGTVTIVAGSTLAITTISKTISTGTILSVNITQIGSTTAGSDLGAELVC